MLYVFLGDDKWAPFNYPKMQVLWLGRPECHASWEPAKCIPLSLVQQFEGGIMAESQATRVPMYGHISGILTVSHSSHETKRKKMERTWFEDLEGCVIAMVLQ